MGHPDNCLACNEYKDGDFGIKGTYEFKRKTENFKIFRCTNCNSMMLKSRRSSKIKGIERIIACNKETGIYDEYINRKKKVISLKVKEKKIIIKKLDSFIKK